MAKKVLYIPVDDPEAKLTKFAPEYDCHEIELKHVMDALTDPNMDYSDILIKLVKNMEISKYAAADIAIRMLAVVADEAEYGFEVHLIHAIKNWLQGVKNTTRNDW